MSSQLNREELDSLVAHAMLRDARQRAQIREAITTKQLATLFRLSLSRCRIAFAAAVVREGGRCKSYLFSRAKIVDVLSELNGRPIPFPTEPLLNTAAASEFLKSHGVHLTEVTLRWYRTQRPELAPTGIKLSGTDEGRGAVRYSKAELMAFAAERLDKGVSQGRRVA